jgi:fructan beta-fructosidase
MKRRDYLKFGAVVTGGTLLPVAAGGRASAGAPAAGDGPVAAGPLTHTPGPAAGGKATTDIVVADFEGTDWSGWTTSGSAFGDGPVHGAAKLASMDVAGYFGDGVASSEGAGDGPTGTLTSPSFTIQRHYLAYGIGGGDYERVTCLNLLVGGKVVRSATGRDTDTLQQGSWDVSGWNGESARIQIVDTSAGDDWGHVIVDRLVQTDTPLKPPETTQPLYQETWRPQVHFTARQWTMDRLNPGQRQEGWLNDLNGLIYYEGEWHLFAQRWNKCWIHAISTDLVHWTESEPAFWEEELGSGVQSGGCVVDYRNTSGLGSASTPAMVAVWSRDDNVSQCVTYSLDRGRTWRFYAGNPVLTEVERDPMVFWYAPDDHWVMMLYGGGTYKILTSPDLLHWTDTGNSVPDSYECPDFFQLPLDGDATKPKWVLVRGNGMYSVGTFDGRRFTEETDQILSDSGANFYATKTWANTETGDGRRVQAAWMRGGAYPEMPFNQQVTFPCELTLHTTPDGPRVFRQPIAELGTLYSSSSGLGGISLPPGGSKVIDTSSDPVRYTFDHVSVAKGATLTLTVRGIPLTVTAQAVACGGDPQPTSGPLTSLDVLVDRTSIEVFANSGEVSVSRCYLPSDDTTTAVATGGSATVGSATVHRLASMWTP